jgi:hypothetical protein
MKLYKETRVVYDAHGQSYDVEYRNWFFWKFEKSYRYDTSKRNPIHYMDQEQAKTSAINLARAMLDTMVVYQQSNYGNAFWG